MGLCLGLTSACTRVVVCAAWTSGTVSRSGREPLPDFWPNVFEETVNLHTVGPCSDLAEVDAGVAWSASMFRRTGLQVRR